MFATKLDLNIKNKSCLDLVTILFVILYGVLVFNVVWFLMNQNHNESRDNLPKLPNTLTETTTETPMKVKKAPEESEELIVIDELNTYLAGYLKYAESNRLIVLEEEMKTLNETENATSIIPAVDDVTKIQIPGWDYKNGKRGIHSRFGFLSIDDIDDHVHLKESEVMKISEAFIFDQFESKSRDSILTYADRTQTFTPPDVNTQLKFFCPIVPTFDKKKYKEPVFEDFNPPDLLHIAKTNPKVTKGGRHTPSCYPRSKIAIIIPFRGRETQLRALLARMHPIWQQQEIDYTVYTITQEYSGEFFNKAKLLNAGFLEASKYDTYDCFVFHDIDMALEDHRCLYRCSDSDNVKHLSVYLEKFGYKKVAFRLPCSKLKSVHDIYNAENLEGVSVMTSKQFHDVNGYSNLYWGGGLENIDMTMRLHKRGYKIGDYYGKLCSYHTIKNNDSFPNEKSEGRFALAANAVQRMRYDGLTSIRYKVLSVERLPLYTNITVDIGQPQEQLLKFMEENFGTYEQRCLAKLPWKD